MTPPKFPLLMPVWINKAGILRPDESDGKPTRWQVVGIRLARLFAEDTGIESFGGCEYLIGGLGFDDRGRSLDNYGWVSEAELVKAEYPAPDWFNRALEPIAAQDHPDPDDVRNMPATAVG